jgi:hypothetical protein
VSSWKLEDKNDDTTLTWASQMYQAQKWSIRVGISLARNRLDWETFASYGCNRDCQAVNQ